MRYTWWHDTRVEGDHFLLIEEVADVAIQHHASHRLQGELLLREDLGVIKRVKVVVVLIFNLHSLDVQCPLRELTCNSTYI